MELEEFLNSKPMSYQEINLERMPKAFNLIVDKYFPPKSCGNPKIVHIIGTNGKGTTGRFLAEIIRKNGFNVGHYSSPHLLKINERFWKNGDDVSDQELNQAFLQLKNELPDEVVQELTYFEFTTLLNLPLFKNMDYIILEAGLGGEFDATNVFQKDLTIFTPIDFDHQNFLGDTLEKIVTTKCNAISSKAILAPQIYDEVLEICQKIADKKGSRLYPFPKQSDNFLETNLKVAQFASRFLGMFDSQITNEVRLKGRLEKIKKNIIIDVGHNPLSAKAVLNHIPKNSILIYNSFADKDFETVLSILKSKIKKVEILEIDDERMVDLNELKNILEKLQIPYSIFAGKISKKEKYFVFGSFRVVEEFLKNYQNSEK